jgi:hypothetical protein
MGVTPNVDRRYNRLPAPGDVAMAQLSNQHVALRCYARRSGRHHQKWLAHCIDLDLWGVGESAGTAKQSLDDAIALYFEGVRGAKTDRAADVLMSRRAPARFFVLWYGAWYGKRLARWLSGHWPVSPSAFMESQTVPGVPRVSA